ncbi:MAG: nucleotidyltransferase family protein [Reyranellaceae bacterium]
MDILLADPSAMAQLRAVRDLSLPDWCIAGGFVRNRVWDALTGQREEFPADTDVLFFDPADASRQREAALETRLRAVLPDIEWQVRNQARMHEFNGDPPYRDTAQAMTFWLETCTAVGARLTAEGGIEIIAPQGLDDLMNLVFRPTEAGRKHYAAYRQRIDTKPWRRRWPTATFII